MQNLLNKTELTKIIEADHPTDAKVEAILALAKQDKINLINAIDNQVGITIDNFR